MEEKDESKESPSPEMRKSRDGPADLQVSTAKKTTNDLLAMQEYVHFDNKFLIFVLSLNSLSPGPKAMRAELDKNPAQLSNRAQEIWN